MLIIFILSILGLVAVDQGIKYWAIHVLQEKGSIPFLRIGDFKIMDLTYLENTGAVFGSFSGMKWFLIIITTLLMAWCLYYFIRHKNRSKLLATAVILVVSGGIGNSIDRLFRAKGAVIDYFDLQLFDFAVFNFADCCVVIGVILFMIYVLFIEGKNEKKKLLISENKDKEDSSL